MVRFNPHAARAGIVAVIRRIDDPHIAKATHALQRLEYLPHHRNAKTAKAEITCSGNSVLFVARVFLGLIRNVSRERGMILKVGPMIELGHRHGIHVIKVKELRRRHQRVPRCYETDEEGPRLLTHGRIKHPFAGKFRNLSVIPGMLAFHATGAEDDARQPATLLARRR